MDEIIAFSDLEDFIDLPVKNYSSGMYVRLGFAIAALSQPDVLLMDEVLAVGDLNFQKKCYDYIHQLKNQGTAIILVSHSPGAIWSVCDRALFMDRGTVELDGNVEDVIKAYTEQNSRNAIRSAHNRNNASKLIAEYGLMKGGTGDVVCDHIKLFDQFMTEKNEFEFGESINIEVFVEIKNPLKKMQLRITADAVHYRYIAVIDSYEKGLILEEVHPGLYRLKVTLHKPNFRPGAYFFNFSVTQKDAAVHMLYWNAAAKFVVKNPSDHFLFAHPTAVMHIDSHFDFGLVDSPALSIASDSFHEEAAVS